MTRLSGNQLGTRCITEKPLSPDLRRRSAEGIRGAGATQGEFVSLYQKQDKSLGLLQDYAGDEDCDYYALKLHKFAERLREAFTPGEFDSLFSKPVPSALRRDPGQITMDLFW